MANPPTTEEKLVTVANKTGFLLQEKCHASFKEWHRKAGQGFILEADMEVPYTYPPSTPYCAGEPGSVDVLGRAYSQWDKQEPATVYVIECKRPDRIAKNWLFFINRRDDNLRPLFLQNKTVGSSRAELTINDDVRFPHLGKGLLDDFEYAYQGVEVSDKLESINTNHSEKIYKSLSQAITAAFGIAISSDWIQRIRNEWRIEHPSEDVRKITFLPIVLTTAPLYVMTHNPEDINWESGEVTIDSSNAKAVDFVTFNFGIPDYLIAPLRQPDGTYPINPDSLTVVIVRSTRFEAFARGTIPGRLR